MDTVDQRDEQLAANSTAARSSSSSSSSKNTTSITMTNKIPIFPFEGGATWLSAYNTFRYILFECFLIGYKYKRRRSTVTVTLAIEIEVEVEDVVDLFTVKLNLNR